MFFKFKFSSSLISLFKVGEFTREGRPETKAVEITYLCYSKNNEHEDFKLVDKNFWKNMDPITEMQKENLENIFSNLEKLKL